MGNITGIVVKLTEKHIVLIMPDGCFKNVKRSRGQTPLIGERLTLDATRIPVSYYRWAAAAAVICLVLAAFLNFGILMPGITNPAYIIALDINPSIEIQTDDKLNTLSVTALNEDGEKVTGGIAYTNTDVFEVLDSIIARCINNGYLVQERKGLISITVVSLQGNSFAYESRIRDSIEKMLVNNSIDARLETGYASIDQLDKARNCKLSLNRYMLYQGLIKRGINVSVEEAGEMPLQDLRNYEALHRTGEGVRGPQQDNGTETASGADSNIKQGNTGETGLKGAVSPGSSESSDDNGTDGNNDPAQKGTAQDNTDGNRNKIPDAGTDNNASGGSDSPNAGAGPDTSGTDSGSAGSSETTMGSSEGSGNTQTPEPEEKGSENGQTADPGQSPEQTESGSTGGSTSGPGQKAGGNQSTEASNNRVK